MSTDINKLVRRRRNLRTLIGAAAFAAGSILLTAPTANAISEQDIKSECEDIGGTYQSATVNGHRYSSCDYTIDGDWHSDTYKDGKYTGTLDKRVPVKTADPTPSVGPSAIGPR